MSNLLNTLCDVLDEELRRQESVLAACRAQRGAVAAHDVDGLDVNTEALGALVRDVRDAEAGRLEVLRAVVDEYGLPREQQTLTELIRVVPEPWRTRLAGFQKSLRNILGETRRLIHENSRTIRRGLLIVDDCLARLVVGTGETHKGYDDRGMELARALQGPAFIDQKG